VIASVAVVSLVFFALNPRGEGPVYKGRHLSEWVEMLGTHTQGTPAWIRASEAIRASGTNAFPYLVKWLPHEEKSWRTKIGSKLQPWEYRIESASLGWSRAEKRAQGVPTAFALLYQSPPPPSVIAELSRHLDNANRPRTGSRAAACLAQLGHSGVPPLAEVLLSPGHPLRRNVAVVCIQPNVPTPVFATAYPALLTLLQNPKADVLEELTNALLQIAPEVLTNAPPP
jgi:hypothetical protein